MTRAAYEDDSKAVRIRTNGIATAGHRFTLLPTRAKLSGVLDLFTDSLQNEWKLLYAVCRCVRILLEGGADVNSEDEFIGIAMTAKERGVDFWEGTYDTFLLQTALLQADLK